MARRVQVALPVPSQAVFDYLLDPARRIEWMGGIRRVEGAAPLPVQVGTTWRELGLAEVVSDVRLTELQPPQRWTEEWRGKAVRTRVAYVLDEAPGGCRVTAHVEITGAGWLAKLLMERAQTRLLDQAIHRAGEVLVEGPGRARPESRGDF